MVPRNNLFVKKYEAKWKKSVSLTLLRLSGRFWPTRFSFRVGLIFLCVAFLRKKSVKLWSRMPRKFQGNINCLVSVETCEVHTAISSTVFTRVNSGNRTSSRPCNRSELARKSQDPAKSRGTCFFWISSDNTVPDWQLGVLLLAQCLPRCTWWSTSDKITAVASSDV